jgi:hypothetical protein
MFALPEDYLETYRSHIQEVTIPQVQEAATKYVRPDEAAVVIVGDGAQIADQVKPFAEEIEFYNTAGKKKDKPASTVQSPEVNAKLAGTWSLVIESPLGQSIPATLILQNLEKLARKWGTANCCPQLLTVSRLPELFRSTSRDTP